VIELCELNKVNIAGIIDNHKKGDYLGYIIIGTDNDANKLFDFYAHIPLIITPDQPNLRKHLANEYQKLGYLFMNLVSSYATVSKSAHFGIGVVIHNQANISANVEICDFVKVNTNANVMHDSIIGNYTTIAPNAVILGRVKIGNLSYIGANATILPGISIGDNVIIGAGAVVTRNVQDGKIMVGNPAKELRINDKSK
jgi:UDP-N-acetylbacillosamine N-acetyltransferase